MNAMGKILVILNFLFAVATLGFISYYVANAANTAKDNAAQRREMEIARANAEASKAALTRLNNEMKKALADLDDVKIKLVEQEAAAKATEANLNLKIAEEKNRADDARLNLEKAEGELKRMQLEVKELAQTLKLREKLVLDLGEETKKYRAEAVAQESIAKLMQARNENLIGQIQRLTETIADLQKGPAEVGRPLNPNQPNPPRAFVKGKVERVDSREGITFVVVSVGTDHGLQRDNTLEVYRRDPRPEYLGMIRIVEADHHQAIGRLVRSGVGSRSPLQPGDIVASTTDGR